MFHTYDLMTAKILTPQDYACLKNVPVEGTVWVTYGKGNKQRRKPLVNVHQVG